MAATIGDERIVDCPDPDATSRLGEAVEVGVEQREAALVLGHEDEGRRGDRRGHAQAAPERLRQMGLAGAELAP